MRSLLGQSDKVPMNSRAYSTISSASVVSQQSESNSQVWFDSEDFKSAPGTPQEPIPLPSNDFGSGINTSPRPLPEMPDYRPTVPNYRPPEPRPLPESLDSYLTDTLEIDLNRDQVALERSTALPYTGNDQKTFSSL